MFNLSFVSIKIFPAGLINPFISALNGYKKAFECIVSTNFIIKSPVLLNDNISLFLIVKHFAGYFVKFPLDIIFFDSSMEYIEHYTMEPGHEVEEKNLPKYKSTKPARFAVELPSGWCEKNMKPNCKLSF